MHGFLAWMYASALGHFMRESGPWTYAIVNLAHILGIASLFGAVLIIDLRLLGVWRRTPLAVLTHVAVPVAAGGFGLATLSGIGLLAANATEYVGNPFFYVKFPAIAIGLVNAFVVSVSPAWEGERHARADGHGKSPAGVDGRDVAGLLADRDRRRADDRLLVERRKARDAGRRAHLDRAVSSGAH